MKGLSLFLEAHPEASHVYFNETESEWTLQVDKNHPIEKTRDEVIEYVSTLPDSVESKLKTAVGLAENYEILLQENQMLKDSNSEYEVKEKVWEGEKAKLLKENDELDTACAQLEKSNEELNLKIAELSKPAPLVAAEVKGSQKNK